MTHAKTVESIFDNIMESDLFRVNGHTIEDLPAVLIELCEEIEQVDEADSSDWINLGGCLECTCPDLLIGAYWALTDWHGGLYSDTYRALCAIGRIYTPNMSHGPEPDTGEEYAYQQVSAWLKDHS